MRVGAQCPGAASVVPARQATNAALTNSASARALSWHPRCCDVAAGAAMAVAAPALMRLLASTATLRTAPP
eukprot:2160026-Pyramimonas_sp.AAC.1